MSASVRFVAAEAEAAPATAMAMRIDAPTLLAIRRVSKNDKNYPFSFCAYGVS